MKPRFLVLVGVAAVLSAAVLLLVERQSPSPSAPVERPGKRLAADAASAADEVQKQRRQSEAVPPPSHYSRRPKSGDQASNRKVSSRFPNILLSTHNGKMVRFYDDLVKDRIVIVNFMYTTCTGT